MVKQNYQTPLLQYPIQHMPPYLSCVKHYYAIYLVLYLCLSVSTLWLTIIILIILSNSKEKKRALAPMRHIHQKKFQQEKTKQKIKIQTDKTTYVIHCHDYADLVFSPSSLPNQITISPLHYLPTIQSTVKKLEPGCALLVQP